MLAVKKYCGTKSDHVINTINLNKEFQKTIIDRVLELNNEFTEHMSTGLTLEGKTIKALIDECVARGKAFTAQIIKSFKTNADISSATELIARTTPTRIAMNVVFRAIYAVEKSKDRFNMYIADTHTQYEMYYDQYSSEYVSKRPNSKRMNIAGDKANYYLSLQSYAQAALESLPDEE